MSCVRIGKLNSLSELNLKNNQFMFEILKESKIIVLYTLIVNFKKIEKQPHIGSFSRVANNFSYIQSTFLQLYFGLQPDIHLAKDLYSSYFQIHILF